MRWMNRVGLSGGGALLLGCATMTILTEHPSDVAFQQLQAYDWASDRTLGIADPRLDTARVARSIQLAIEVALLDRGYERRAVNPDFMIDYHAALEHRTVEAVAQIHCPQDEWDLVTIGPDIRYCRELDVGTLTVDFMVPETGRIIWRGMARDEVDWRMSATEIDKRIQKVIRKIIDRFPPT